MLYTKTKYVHAIYSACSNSKRYFLCLFLMSLKVRERESATFDEIEVQREC